MVAKNPKHRRRKKPYLTDNIELGRVFRKTFVSGLKRLIQQGELQLGGNVDFLNDKQQRQDWLDQLEATDWNVFIEGPPNGDSKPSQVLKYLARYLTGGPIADSRIIGADDNEVWFHARSKKELATKVFKRHESVSPLSAQRPPVHAAVDHAHPSQRLYAITMLRWVSWEQTQKLFAKMR